jgi:hypothetical protein
MVLKHLKRHGTITPVQALNLYGCFRLAARVYELRARGFVIETEKHDSPDANWAIYRLKRGRGKA